MFFGQSHLLFVKDVCVFHFLCSCFFFFIGLCLQLLRVFDLSFCRHDFLPSLASRSYFSIIWDLHLLFSLPIWQQSILRVKSDCRLLHMASNPFPGLHPLPLDNFDRNFGFLILADHQLHHGLSVRFVALLPLALKFKLNKNYL